VNPAIDAVCFFTFFETNGQPLAAQLDWVLICSVAVLPAVGFLWIAYMRRERALDELTKGEGSKMVHPLHLLFAQASQVHVCLQPRCS
jgi:hypothetical protein